jgi:tetratricopeptide (TPR) repeat protein
MQTVRRVRHTATSAPGARPRGCRSTVALLATLLLWAGTAAAAAAPRATTTESADPPRTLAARTGVAAAARSTAPDADAEGWIRLAWREQQLGNRPRAAAAFLQVARGWPALLPNIDPRLVHGLLRREGADPTARLAVMQALFDSDWDRQRPAASHVWFELALARLERGEPALAATALARIRLASELVKLRIDRRFDALVDPGAPAFDVERAARGNVLELMQAATGPQPPEQVLVELGFAMLTAGMDDGLLRMTDDILAAAEGAGGGTAIEAGERAWLLAQRAIALRRLGRVDAALEQLRQASRIDQAGEGPRLQLALLHCSLNQPAAARRVLAGTDAASAHGHMLAATVRLRAALREGDRAEVAQAIAWLEAHRNDSPRLHLEGLLHAGRIDAAAEVLRDLLAAESTRVDALYWVQQFREPAALPGEFAYREARTRLLARSDVATAVQRVGRRLSFPISGRPAP